jgi:hypothetical protein
MYDNTQKILKCDYRHDKVTDFMEKVRL